MEKASTDGSSQRYQSIETVYTKILWASICHELRLGISRYNQAPPGAKTPYALPTKLSKNLADPHHTNRCAIPLFFVICSADIEYHLVQLDIPIG